MAKLPESADVIIVGQGGIVGASVAHHLIENGWTNIVGLEKSAIPTDIGSTSHASDFCFTTSHDKLNIFTTRYSQAFYARRGNYLRKGGMEVARVDDDEWMEELKRKVGSGKAFGTNVSLITPSQAKELFPLLDESQIQGAMWDPEAGLVVPRSQKVAGDLVDEAVASGHLQAFANTPARRIDVRDGRVCGVETDRGYIRAKYVVLTMGIWGPLMARTAGAPLPLMPVEHPLLFFGPYEALKGTGEDMVWPLFRDQRNSAYVRDTGDPTTTEGGHVEWGYYEPDNPRLVYPWDIAEPENARLSPSMRDLSLEQVMSAYEKAIDITPVLGELGWEEKRSFNGLLSVTPDGGSMIGETPEVRNLWFCEAVWVKDGPGAGKLAADWMTKGQAPMDPHSVDIARHYPLQKTPEYVYSRCYETAKKIYTPAVHPREPYVSSRQMRTSPFYPREVELGGYFMEAAGWERAHGYQANEEKLLAKYRDRIPERRNEWDARHFWAVSNAEQLEMSESVGMINLSHFAIFDISGPDAEDLLEYLSVAKVGGSTPVGKGVYTHFLDAQGGIHSDLTIIRTAGDAYRVICGGDTGHRDLVWIRRMAEDKGFGQIHIQDMTDHMATLGLWGPKAHETLAQFVEDPACLAPENFPFATAQTIWVRGIPVWAFRISYVGEQGWELHVPFSYGLRLWDMLYEAGVTPVGIETYANTRRLEKSLRLQNVDLETDYNLYEAGLARPKVKEADFHGKDAYLEQRQRDHQVAYLCTMTMLDNVDAKGVARYPVGQWPILDPATGEVLIDSEGRRSYCTSVVYGPSVGKIILLGYIPHEFAEEGRKLTLEYFHEPFPIRIEAVGCRALYDPENERMKS
ncbi:FAD-dependent oxidoreductase [Marinobacter nanhaiticus D15-8W]|uniref:FAD-dependent oxidoreductase n=1 Tax=Marinobacter nanhaiticus D15-8W TaxID=626887 RepID=N6W959_9GAMM|nr:FAD-dependent oxidoreductase [Marinobacter nanhaiticus]ENO16784.1 FAD-dependent oxidoreductase [Marinobacter nanhaiticus D15-8W]BES72599.1 FAD-dependent oxidoreductase [Marinobacter nanhaiticus D15-8W]